MEKFIVIKGDYNDGDYDTSINQITDEELEFIKPIIEAIKENGGNFWTRELSSPGESAEEDYGHLECFEFFEDLTPGGDNNYSGIHNIESIEVITKLEKLL